MMEMDKLFKLSGLTPDELADVLENNPRAYMAVKGAVAEEHLRKYLFELGNQGLIKGVKTAQSDLDKDFYITLLNGREVAIECKNVEVLKTNNSKQAYLTYLNYLQSNFKIFPKLSFHSTDDFTSSKFKEIYSSLPQNLRESGVPRFEYSASKLGEKSIKGNLSDKDFLEQFNRLPLTIDFQRTRNSGNKKEVASDPKTNRFYQLEEVDVVAACLFSRTMNWEFVFGSRDSLIIHPRFKDHYSNRLVLDSSLWTSNLLDLFKSI